jgi:hypothetical protein
MEIGNRAGYQFPGWSGIQERDGKNCIEEKERSDSAKNRDMKCDAFGKKGSECKCERSG